MSSPEDYSPVASDIELKVDNEKKPTLLVGIVGGTSSGKTEVCETLMKAVIDGIGNNKEQSIVRISQESFYRDLNSKEQEEADNGERLAGGTVARTQQIQQQGANWHQRRGDQGMGSKKEARRVEVEKGFDIGYEGVTSQA